MAKHHSALTDRYAAGQGDGKIRASHLLVKHRGSRRPSSWREAEITRSKEEAVEILRGYQRRIQSGETTLGDLAMTESDCSSARKKGDLYVLSLYCTSLCLAVSRLTPFQGIFRPWGNASGIRRGGVFAEPRPD
jgi:hypothetical protein